MDQPSSKPTKPNGTGLDLDKIESQVDQIDRQIPPKPGNDRAEAASMSSFSIQNASATLERFNSDLRDLTALYNIGITLGASLRLRDVIWSLYNESQRLVDTTNFALILDDAETETLYFALVKDQGEKIKPFSLKHIKTRELTSRVLEQQSPLLIADLRCTEEVVEVDRIRPDQPIRSWLGVPIRNPILRGDDPQGVIAIWSYDSNAFNDRDLWLLSAIGTQATIPIRNARLFESSQRRATEMALINDVSRALASTLNLEEVLIQLMEQVENMLNAGAGFLLLIDRASGDLVFQMASGDKTEAIKPFRIPKGKGIAGQVALTGKPIWMIGQDRQIDLPARNVLCVPLISQNQVIGVLEVFNKSKGDFSEQDVTLLRSIASFATVAIENARLYDKVLDERDRVIEAEEEARKELARDLHDGPIQAVAGIIMRLNFCQQVLEKEPSLLSEELPKVRRSAERVMHQMRTTLFELRPLTLETEGLEAALQAACNRWRKELEDQQTDLVFEVETLRPDGHIARLDSKVETAIFAIVQETINNAAKHAKASKIVLHLRETSTSLYITVADDGQGFDVEHVMKNYGQRGSLGMVNVKERTELIGGGLSIESTLNHGTHIRVYVPKEKAERLRRRGATGRLTLPKQLW